MLIDKTWDIRCPEKLKELFPLRYGFYYKINMEQALQVVTILSTAYHISIPNIGRIPKYLKCNAAYDSKSKTILMYNRNHLKSIFHEFYHHLDNETNGKYNSDDNRGGETSNSWIFADKLWEQFIKYKSTAIIPEEIKLQTRIKLYRKLLRVIRDINALNIEETTGKSVNETFKAISME